MGLDVSFFQERGFDFSPSFKELLTQILTVPGKGLRGRLLMLAAGGEEAAERLASVKHLAQGIEILHLATLIHDDLVDRGEIRRGHTAVWKKWGDKTAVLIGDYLFATAYRIISKISGEEGMKRVNLLLKEMVEAELEEEQERFLHLPASEYIGRIEKKTARFFQVVCELGGEVASYPWEVCLQLGRFGKEIGIAYQLLDDLLDLTGDGKDIGKPLFQDLKNGVVTLPLILISEQPVFREVLRKTKTERSVEPWMIKEIRRLLAQGRVPEYIRSLVDEYRRRAKQHLSKLELPQTSLLTSFADHMFVALSNQQPATPYKEER